MHDLLLAATFVAMVLAPCAVTMFRSDEEEC
jgi:hypothetical protein